MRLTREFRWITIFAVAVAVSAPLGLAAAKGAKSKRAQRLWGQRQAAAAREKAAAAERLEQRKIEAIKARHRELYRRMRNGESINTHPEIPAKPHGGPLAGGGGACALDVVSFVVSWSPAGCTNGFGSTLNSACSDGDSSQCKYFQTWTAWYANPNPPYDGDEVDCGDGNMVDHLDLGQPCGTGPGGVFGTQYMCNYPTWAGPGNYTMISTLYPGSWETWDPEIPDLASSGATVPYGL